MGPHYSEGTEMSGCISVFVSNIHLCKVSHCAVLIVSSEDAQMQPTAAKSEFALGPEMALHFGSGQHHVFWSDNQTNVELFSGHYKHWQ